jgi:hypothetical protein
MTAVEWLMNELFTKHSLTQQIIDTFEHALEMEKQQIMEAYVDGFKECEKTHEEAFFIQDLSEQYYNETYKPST